MPLCLEEWDPTKKNENEDDVNEKHVLNDFFTSVRINILRDKNAYLLTQLLFDWKHICNERGITTVISHSYQIRKRLEEEFPEDIGFFNSGRNVIVYCATMNPCQYSVATLQGSGLRDIDLAKGFAAMIKRKLKCLEQKSDDFPFTEDKLISELEKGPMTDLYNVIYLTVKDNCQLNKHGYATTISKNLATKIWSLAYDWEALVTGQPNAKQVLMGMTIHRITGSKEVANYLNKGNHAISYNDIRMQNKAWEKMVMSGINIKSDIKTGLPTHSSIDNNDGRQETLTGSGTTHHTNSLLFQPYSNVSNEVQTLGIENHVADTIERNHPGM